MLNLLVVEIFESNRHLILTLLVEYDFESTSVIVDFETGSHGFVNLARDSTDNDNLNKR